MTKSFLENLIEKLRLQILILQLQIKVKILKKKLTIPNLPQPKYVVIHHSGGDWSFEKVNYHHKNKWGFKSSLGCYLGYHKWIDYAGNVITARRDNEEGAHCVDPARPGYWNKNSVGICVRGNTDIKKPPEWQLRALRNELDSYIARGFKVKYHGQIVPNVCPGKHLRVWLSENGYLKRSV